MLHYVDFRPLSSLALWRLHTGWVHLPHELQFEDMIRRVLELELTPHLVTSNAKTLHNWKHDLSIYITRQHIAWKVYVRHHALHPVYCQYTLNLHIYQGSFCALDRCYHTVPRILILISLLSSSRADNYFDMYTSPRRKSTRVNSLLSFPPLPQSPV